MEVFLNEDCIYKRAELDSDAILHFLENCIEKLNYYNIKIYSDSNAFTLFIDDLNLSTQKKTFYTQLFKKINDFVENNNPKYYYYYFIHQDFGLSISESVSTTSLSDATDRFLQNNDVVIVNIPVSKYCSRPVIPVVKSPYNSRQIEELANIPCFNDIGLLSRHYLIFFKLIKFIDTAQISDFEANYVSVLNNFDFDNWHPLTYSSKDVLDSKCAFPASGNAYLTNFFDNLKISIGNYHENFANYVELGNIVLNLHGYKKNLPISRKYSREIFEGGSGTKKLLISLDTENGLLEVIGRDGTHIGVYNYAGLYQKHYTKKVDINTHSLREMPPHLFLFD